MFKILLNAMNKICCNYKKFAQLFKSRTSDVPDFKNLFKENAKINQTMSGFKQE